MIPRFVRWSTISPRPDRIIWIACNPTRLLTSQKIPPSHRVEVGFYKPRTRFLPLVVGLRSAFAQGVYTHNNRLLHRVGTARFLTKISFSTIFFYYVCLIINEQRFVFNRLSVNMLSPLADFVPFSRGRGGYVCLCCGSLL
jgi:uncharacterized membrane protein YagU involved in acid resistance